MAIHYYDEEKIEIGKTINTKVVVNHTDFKEKKTATKKQKAVKQKSVTEPFEQLSMF